MSIDLRDYTSENEKKLTETLYSAVNDFEQLYNRYKIWSRRYGSLYNKQSNITAVAKYYESVISFLKDAGTKFKKVYGAAESAESKLVKALKYNCNRTDMLNRKLSAYLNINRYPAVFARDDFSKIMETEILKVSSEIVIDAIDTYSQDGKWLELLESDNLSNEEYNALAAIYFTLNDADKEKFINLCYVKTGEFERNISTMMADAPKSRGMPDHFVDRESCSFFEIDKEKVLRLQNCMEIWISNNYVIIDLLRDEYGEIPKELLIHRDNMIQDAGLFHAILQTGQVTGKFHSNSPRINIEKNKYGEYILNYTCVGRVVRPYEPPYTIVNFCDRALTVTRPHCGDSTDDEMVNNLNREFIVKYGISCKYDIYYDNIGEGVLGVMTDKYLEKVLGKFAEKVPIVDIVTTGISIAQEINEFEEEKKYAEHIIYEMNHANYLDIFKLSCVFIEPSNPNERAVIYIQPGTGTQEVIDLYNEYLSDEPITMDDVLYDSDKIKKALKELKERDADGLFKYNIITRGY